MKIYCPVLETETTCDCDDKCSAVITYNYPQIFFAIQWAVKNMNTARINGEDLTLLKSYADECHVAYLKEIQP